VCRPRAPGSHPGRRRPPADAEVVELELPVPEAERLDEQGQPLPFLGWRTSDKWDYRPGSYLIRRFKRAIHGKPFSAAEDRVVASLPTMLIPRGAMTDAAVIHTVVEKFADHLPLYRQGARAERCGFPLARGTMVNHVTAVADAMGPIIAVLSDQVRQSSYIHLDDTPVRMLDPGRGRTATTRIWVFRSPTATVFRFSTTRAGRHPGDFLGDYRGHIVADAYAGHEQLYGIDQAAHAACWAHARRTFSDIKHHAPLALEMMEEIQRLYDIEAAARHLTDADRQRRRHERSRPIVDRITQRLDQAAANTLPASALGIAINYARQRWPQLRRFLDHGFLPIDNNPAENALRPWAIGRKNWLFFGSPAGGERAAAIGTIIENCRQQHLDPYRYLCDTIAALHTGTTDYAALTPRAVAERQDTAGIA
jgi:transposase